MAAEVEHVVLDAGQLGEQHADILRAQRHLEPHQFLDGEHEAVLHAHRRAVIEPVEVGQRLGVGLVLDQLLGAAVEQADMRVDPLDDLAVQLHDQPQHAVRGRVLRAEIDRVIADRRVAGVAGARAPTPASPAGDVASAVGLPSACFGVGLRSTACRLAGGFGFFAPGFVASRRWPAIGGFGVAASCRRRRRRRRARRFAGRLLVARQAIFGAFPRAHEVERAEVLGSDTGS